MYELFKLLMHDKNISAISMIIKDITQEINNE